MKSLKDFFSENPRVAIAFSGGTDSSLLLAEAIRAGAVVKAYYVRSPFQPRFELLDAKRLALELDADMEIIDLDVLAIPEIAANPHNRCYYCKRQIFGAIISAASGDGFPVVLDGSNASDDPADRPGMKALSELKVLSPLRDLGLTKEDVRRLSKEAGLFTWDKPAYACLATRIPALTPISRELLEMTENAETQLYKMGFRDFRVRYRDGAALIQLREEDLPVALSKRDEIVAALTPAYREIYLDLKVRR